MLEAVATNRVFDFLPTFNFGKLWSLLGLTKPSRPLTAQERAQRFHDVTVDGKPPVRPDDLMGQVYITPDRQRVIYWHNETRDPTALKAQYVPVSPDDVLKSGEKETVRWSEVRSLGAEIDAEDRRQMLGDYYGEQKASALIAHTLG